MAEHGSVRDSLALGLSGISALHLGSSSLYTTTALQLDLGLARQFRQIW